MGRLGPRSMFGYETFFFGEDEGGVPGIEMNAVSPVCEMLSLGKQEIGDIADHHPAFSEHLYAAMTVSIVDQLTDSTGEGEYWARQRAEKKEREAQRKSSKWNLVKQKALGKGLDIEARLSALTDVEGQKMFEERVRRTSGNYATNNPASPHFSPHRRREKEARSTAYAASGAVVEEARASDIGVDLTKALNLPSDPVGLPKQSRNSGKLKSSSVTPT